MTRRKTMLAAALVTAAASMLLIGGCNTIAGIGYDIQSIGKSVQGSADETRSGLNSAVGVESRPTYEPTNAEVASRRY